MLITIFNTLGHYTVFQFGINIPESFVSADEEPYLYLFQLLILASRF